MRFMGFKVGFLVRGFGSGFGQRFGMNPMNLHEPS